VTHGIYRYSRNPIYLGLSVLYTGLSLLGSCLWALALLPVLILSIRRFLILPEERYLLRRFGEAYAAYCSDVGRWLEVGPVRIGRPAGSSQPERGRSG
jgi:protein-S-isoprenylcysteine O-methyltransferase Ste14